MRVVRYPSICLGRHALSRAVVASAQERRSVLLFGGRQAGKTTLLRHIQERMVDELRAIGEFGGSPVGVYVDLLGLPFDARPPEFYSLLARSAVTACRSLDTEDKSRRLTDSDDASPATIDEFQENLCQLFRQTGGLADEFVFLLDESKRVLGSRFPRGFQDNLFSLLYGNGGPVRVSFVFSGAQDLYSLLEDSTSPIGSRSAVHVIKNLTRVDVHGILTHFSKHLGSDHPSIATEGLADFVFGQTGGHAGVSFRLAESIANTTARGKASFGFDEFEMDFLPQIAWLYQHWCRSFTRETNLVLDAFSSRDELCLRDIAMLLEQNGYNRFLADLVWNELTYCGVAVERDDSALIKTSRAFWRYRRKFEPSATNSDATRDEWKLIERTEVALRGFVRSRFEGKWGEDSLKAMRRILGSQAWARLESIRDRSHGYYPYARNKRQRDVMECMYLGQLGELMLNSDSWPLFRNAFRDKRQFQDILATITPVRNDRGHFVSVDDKELRRCEVNCDDLLVIIEREIEQSSA